MRNKFLMISVIIATLFISLTSCSYRLVDFTIISSKNHSLGIDKTKGVRVEASSNGFLGLGSSIKDAMDRALEKAGPDYDLLIDGVVKRNDYFFVLGYKVQGVAVRSSQLRVDLGEAGFQEWYKVHDIFNPETAMVQK